MRKWLQRAELQLLLKGPGLKKHEEVQRSTCL